MPSNSNTSKKKLLVKNQNRMKTKSKKEVSKILKNHLRPLNSTIFHQKPKQNIQVTPKNKSRKKESKKYPKNKYNKKNLKILSKAKNSLKNFNMNIFRVLLSLLTTRKNNLLSWKINQILKKLRNEKNPRQANKIYLVRKI